MADLRPRPWQHVTEPATPVETDGERIAREWFVEWRPNLADLARRIDENRAAQQSKLDDAMAVLTTWGSIDLATAVAQRDALHAALLATRDHDEPDGPCWCERRRLGQWMGEYHGPVCREARRLQPDGTGLGTER